MPKDDDSLKDKKKSYSTVKQSAETLDIVQNSYSTDKSGMANQMNARYNPTSRTELGNYRNREVS